MRRHWPSVISGGLVLLLLAACANPYHEFYKPSAAIPTGADVRTLPGVLPADGPLQIFNTADMQRDVREMRRRGWYVIGWSSFNGGGKGVSERNLRAQAEAVGAQAVLISSKYTNTVSGAMPLVLPNNSTSYTTGTATAYGSGGMINAYGSSTTTTYGTTTTMVPYSVNRYDYGAVFFVRTKQRLGLYPKALDDAERQKLQTNSAVSVDFVVEGSPAFRADVLPGDYVLSIAGQPPSGPDDFLNRVKAHEGEEIDLVLLRGDQRITKRVHVNRY